MKIGKFKINETTGFGPVVGGYWVDLPGFMKLYGRNVPNMTFEEYLTKDKNEFVLDERLIAEEIVNSGKYSSVVHRLDESCFLPPAPERPRLFTLRGCGSMFSRIISLPVPCHPTFELRYPHNIAGNNSTFIIPDNYKDGGWNIELVAVMGKGGRDITEQDAYDYVAGYTILMDHFCILKDSPFYNEWKVEENEVQLIDNFYMTCFNGNAFAPCPVGPWITTTDEIDDPHDLCTMERERNRMVSRGHSSGVLFTLAQTISFLSRMTTLKAGDMISSSSISYDTYRHWQHYEPGDYAEVHVEKIGSLRMYFDDRRREVK